MRFDNFRVVERASWDTLMFFYGVVLSVGGLAALGYLTLISTSLYGSFGETTTHLIIGLSSSLIDNIPVMYAILSMDIPMSTEQWLLATLCIGLGGSILSIGSAAGVAMMGQANGIYTFKAHLKWSWVIILGYALSAGYHIVFIL
jgi:Na+/H+ antiporter NhaD/arsenite permease-like protein